MVGLGLLGRRAEEELALPIRSAGGGGKRRHFPAVCVGKESRDQWDPCSAGPSLPPPQLKDSGAAVKP